ncbi:MAG: T9SS type A sorting domain-containing protein [Bacteroidia bacterium]
MAQSSTFCLSFLWIFLFFSQSVFTQNASQHTTDAQALVVEKAQNKQQSLRFSKNIGQIDQSVLYHVNDLQADHYFMANEIRTVLRSRAEKTLSHSPKVSHQDAGERGRRHGQEERIAEESEEILQTSFAYGLTFLGTAGPEMLVDLRPEIVQSIGKKNYLKGSGRYTDIPQYGQIRYQSLWEGIDVDFYEHQKQLKYDFIVAPFADPAQIQFSLNGVSEVHLDKKTGELSFLTPFGELRKGTPYTYQMIKGKKIEISSSYEIKNGNISFKLGSYDQRYPLVIDPIALKFATFLGGNADDYIYDIYVHPSSKKIYLTGITRSSSFPGVTGTAVTNTANYDGFITCMSKDGSSVLWTTIIGGDEDDDYLYKIHVSDDEDDIFVSGHSQSDDYPTDGLLAPYAAEQAGGNNPIISRLNGDGTVLKYSSYFPVLSFALERYTVVGDVVYGATYYNYVDAANYPLTMPAGAYITTPPSEGGHNGQVFFGINTALAGDSSFQYGTFWYDTTAGAYSRLEFSDADTDGDGNIYFGGYFDIGEPGDGPEHLFPSGGIQSMDEIYDALLPDGANSTAGWVAQFDPSLSSLIYATPFIPVMHNDYMEVSQYDYLFNLEVTDNGDIYTSHVDNIYDIVDFDNLSIAPTAKYSNLQALKLNSDDLILNVASKIAASDRTQFEYIITAAGDWGYTSPSAGAKVDSEGRLHWLFSKDKDDIQLDALATAGALQSDLTSGYQTQYVILSPGGDWEYATIIGPSVDFGSNNMDVFAHASFVSEEGALYVGGMVETDAQKTFPVTPSYWDAETASQVFVYDATPTNNTEGWLAVFHEPTPTTNVINNFAVGNDTFCVNGLVYQNPNYGPILGDPLSFQSGDGSLATHVLADIRPTPFTEAQPEPNAGDALHWEISRDNGTSWSPLPNSQTEVYKPQPEAIAGTVQYRRVYTYGPADTPNYSNIATAVISGISSLALQSPNDPVYFCPTSVEDISFPITGATGNISWQWYNGFAPLDNATINPASGTDVAANFQASIPTSVAQGGFYRLAVEDESGCANETFITTLPLSEDAGSDVALAICPSDAANEVIIGPSTPNPDFEYAWTGPSGFTSSLANPVVSLDGTYYLQVKLVGEPTFCSGGETSVAILPLTAHDSVLVDTTIDLSFCQTDAATPIGLTGPTPKGYSFQWSPAINIDDPSAFNPTYFPSSLAFGPPISTINYRFSAIRLSDGCVFEDTITVSTTAIAQARAGQDRTIICVDSFTIGSKSTGDHFEWRAIATSFPGDLAALTGDPDFTIDGASGNLGSNKFANIAFPDPGASSYNIDFELRSSYLPFTNSCFSADTLRLTISPCNPGNTTVCPDIYTSATPGSGGVCDAVDNQLAVNEISGASYQWTTYAVDGVLQSTGTPPRGLFEEGGDPLSATGPHPTSVKTDLDDAGWGWTGAYSVEYEITANIYLSDTTLICSDRIIVYSSIIGQPIVDLSEIDFCYTNSPASLLSGNGNNLPYQLTGSDYNVAPNTLLKWAWSGGPIDSDADTPYPTISPTTSTSYFVLVTDTLTACTSKDTFEVSLHNIIADAGPDLSTACTGSVVQIGSTAKSNHTYQWTPSTGLNFPIGTPNSTVAKPYLSIPASPTSYSLIATETTTGCQATDTVLITPETNTPVAPTTAAYNSCPGGELVIGTLYSPSAGIDFAWSAGTGANLSWLNNTTTNQPTVSLPDNFSGPATFTLTVSNGSCGSAFTDYIITNQVADVELGPDVNALCQTPYIQIGSATQTAGYTYTWSPNTGLFTDNAGTSPYSGQNTHTVFAKPNNNTQYTLIARNTATACLFLDKITVNAPAGVDVNAGDDQVLCPGETSVSIGQSGSGTIAWNAIGYSSDPTNSPATPSSADSTTMMGYLSSINTLSVNFSQSSRTPGVYQYQITADYGGGCTAIDEVLVRVPTITTGLAGNSMTLCNGESTTIGTTAVAGVNYTWSILNPTAQSGTISDNTSANPSINPSATTSYRLSYSDAASSCELSEIITVNVIASPSIADVSMGPYCAPMAAQNLPAQIATYGSLASTTWHIDYEGGPIESNPTAVQISRSTNFYLLSSNSDACRDTAVITVLVEDPQTPSILSTTNVDCNSGLVDLADFQGNPSDPNNTFEWHSDNTTNPASLLSSTVVGKGTYYLFEKSPSGCFSSSDNIVVSDASCPTPFPVEWLEFTVEQERSNAWLRWSTASEINADYYRIERSIDGTLFMEVAQINANNTSNQLSQYQWLDRDVLQMGQRKLFYRLLQTDRDGQYSYSNVVQLELTGMESMLSWVSASPVPANEFLTVKYQLINTPNARLKITNILGASLVNQNIQQAQGQTEIDVRALPSGYYYLSLEGENGKSVIKFQVRH